MTFWVVEWRFRKGRNNWKSVRAMVFVKRASALENKRYREEYYGDHCEYRVAKYVRIEP